MNVRNVFIDTKIRYVENNDIKYNSFRFEDEVDFDEAIIIKKKNEYPKDIYDYELEDDKHSYFIKDQYKYTTYVDNNFTINSGYYYSVFYLKNMVSIV
jgi:hypothetical protein